MFTSKEIKKVDKIIEKLEKIIEKEQLSRASLNALIKARNIIYLDFKYKYQKEK